MIDGYSYDMNRKTVTLFNWECSKRKNHHCKVRVQTQLLQGEHQILKSPPLHSQEPLAYEKNICAANAVVKSRARESEIQPAIIIRNLSLKRQILILIQLWQVHHRSTFLTNVTILHRSVR